MHILAYDFIEDGHTWIPGETRVLLEAGIVCKCGFTNWFYFLAVFKEVFKIT